MNTIEQYTTNINQQYNCLIIYLQTRNCVSHLGKGF